MAMTRKQKIRWLGRYRQAVSVWDSLNRELEACMSRTIRTTQFMSGMPGGGSGQTRADSWAEETERFERELRKAILDARRTMEEVRGVIDRVENPACREALAYTYINGFGQDYAAAQMGYSVRNFRRLLIDALQAVVIIAPDDGVWCDG